MRYYPRRPVKSFQDLEVYQKTLGLGVEVIKKVTRDNRTKTEWKTRLINKLLISVSNIPIMIATAHSIRFGESEESIRALEKAMLNCNLAVVYLEQYRDLINKKIETEFFEEQIKGYLQVRYKIMHLQKSWLRFMGQKAKEKNAK